MFLRLLSSSEYSIISIEVAINLEPWKLLQFLVFAETFCLITDEIKVRISIWRKKEYNRRLAIHDRIGEK